MRRTLLTAIALCLLGAGAAPISATPGANAGVAQVALADWIEMDGRRGTIYAALGIRGANSTFGAESVGVVFKGRCKRFRDGRFTVIMCSASGVAKTVGPQEFWVDPRLESASLDLTADGFDHSVDWTGGRGEEYGGVHSGDRRTVASHEMIRNARAGGEVYGHRVASRDSMWNLGLLYSGAGVLVRHDLERLGIHVQDDGAVRLERTIRLR